MAGLRGVVAAFARGLDRDGFPDFDVDALGELAAMCERRRLWPEAARVRRWLEGCPITRSNAFSEGSIQ